jgi:5-methylcytosine-specific restriction endonuclease McrA
MPIPSGFSNAAPKNSGFSDRSFYRSAAWRALWLAVYRRSRGWCERCGRALMVQVHHRTYARFGGAEALDDLLGVCRPCHVALHRHTKGDTLWAKTP